MWKILLSCTLLLIGNFTQRRSVSVEAQHQYRPCVHRSYGYDSTVCVCNSTYCDRVPVVPSLQIGEGVVYTSSKDGLRFNQQQFNFSPDYKAAVYVSAETFSLSVNISTAKRYQKIQGFGGAFTDAASINIMSLSQKSQNQLLKTYFSSEGIEYNMGRIPMASCDFSTHEYTYNDSPGDFDMQNFSLAQEDLKYKIPLILRSNAMRNKPLKLFGSPWSAPAWLKTNNALHGRGSLKGQAGDQYHSAWALYFSRFVEEYKALDVAIWGLTIQNEPNDGFIPDFSFQCMGMTAEQERDFVKLNLGPTLHSRGHGNLKLMIVDGQRFLLPEWATTVLSDHDAAKFVSGIAVHWYTDFVTPADKLSKTHHIHPDYFILGTEACVGQLSLAGEKVKLGSWLRGQRYSNDIFKDLNNWVTGWVDWNLALDQGGGPNWAKNFVDSPIIVNATKDEFYKQPMFYHIGHFSKFLMEGATRIYVNGPKFSDPLLRHVAFIDSDNVTVTMVISSALDSETHLKLSDSSLGSSTFKVPPHSIQTYVWKTRN